MPGSGYFMIAALVVLLLPFLVFPVEGRRLPAWPYVLLIVSGLAMQWLSGGWGAATSALMTGVLAALLLLLTLAAIRSIGRVHLLTGAHIRVLAAGSVWLGPIGALAMLGLALALLLGAGVHQALRARRRPEFTVMAAIAILAVGALQAIPAEEIAVAKAASVGK